MQSSQLDNSELENKALTSCSREGQRRRPASAPGGKQTFQLRESNLIFAMCLGQREGLPITMVVHWSLPLSVKAAETLNPKEPTHPLLLSLICHLTGRLVE